jgi:general secretion pathway protein C
MGSRLASFVIWAAVAASAVFWGLRLSGASPRAPAHASVAGQDTPLAAADLTRLFGAALPPPAPTVAAAPPPPQDNRFKLLGVVAQRRSAPSQGLALISVDGQTAKAYGQGATLDGNTVLLAVRHRRVELGPRGGPVQLTLEMAALPEAARGNLAGGGLATPPGVPAAMPSATVGSPMVPRVVPPPPQFQGVQGAQGNQFNQDTEGEAGMPQAPGVPAANNPFPNRMLGGAQTR